MSVAVDAMRRGAVDFVVKPTTRDRLRVTAQNAVQNFQLKKVVENYEAEIDRSDFCGIIGKSLVMQGVFKSIEAAAPSKASVFVTGETGTGKELIARAVHDLSPRRKAKFVAIFGHVKGAFTGATSDRAGAAELAEGGTLFLDELGEMPIELQPKLLRFLQLGEYQRVGDSTVRKSNIRIVAATNRDALEAVRQGKIREDLYYRLHVIPVALPPLRDRGADILLLAESFLARYSSEEGKSFEGFTRDAEEWMISHNWPGNVRELENLIRQVVVLNTGGSIARAQLPSVDAVQTIEPRREDALILTAADTVPEPEYGLEPLWMTEKKAIERAIALCRGNVVAAAKQLQINPSTIYRKKASWAES
jgi:two-component system repressor protein LuxO